MAIVLRERPEDFEVTEVPLFAPCGEGDHTYLWVEKRGRTTEQVARELALRLDLPAHLVAYAGRKDRHAVTRQWFSVPLVEPARALALPLEQARVLEAVRLRHKLRTGDLRANRFTIRLVGATGEHHQLAARRLREIERRGCANRFGRQRFGRAGDNAQRGAEIRSGRLRARDRRAARFLVSALQSAVFNRVLELRAAPLVELRLGELAIQHDSGGVFRVNDPEAVRERLLRFEISPSGPLFGTKMMAPLHQAAEEEARSLAEFGLPASGWTLRLPRGIHVPGARRALRMRPDEASLEAPTESELVVRFVLAAGAYATVLLEELLPGIELVDCGSSDRSAPGEHEADLDDEPRALS